jgi:hypothetical protein
LGDDMSEVDVGNMFVIILVTSSVISLFAFAMVWAYESNRGVEYTTLKFIGTKYALPPVKYSVDSKEHVSETVVVIIKAGTRDAETVLYETDTYDYDLGRWTKFPDTEIHKFKVIKWAPLPKVN